MLYSIGPHRAPRSTITTTRISTTLLAEGARARGLWVVVRIDEKDIETRVKICRRGVKHVLWERTNKFF
jgi:hypothetical protein